MAVCVLDTECTGFAGDSRASVIELGAVVLTDDGNEMAAFNTLVQPTYPVGAWCRRAMEVNQIDPKLLMYAPEPEVVWDAFLAWLSLHKPVKTVYAFNVSFDQRIMQQTFPVSEHLPWGPCLMRDANQLLFNSRKSIKLEAAARGFGLTVPRLGFHRALFDARLAGQLYQQMCKDRRYSPGHGARL